MRVAIERSYVASMSFGLLELSNLGLVGVTSPIARNCLNHKILKATPNSHLCLHLHDKAQFIDLV